MADYVDRDDENVILTGLVRLERAQVYRWRDEQLIGIAGMDFEKIKQGENRRNLVHRIKNRPTESIEDLITRATDVNGSEEMSKGIQFYAAGIPEDFLFAINRLFSIINWNVKYEILERFLEKQFKNASESHTFVNFNYDLILDRCVQRISNNSWHPFNGYGFRIPSFVIGSSIPGQLSAQPFGTHGGSEGKITILKPHGSLNFLLCYRAKPDWNFDPKAVPVMPLHPSGEVRYWSPRGLTDLTRIQTDSQDYSRFHRIFIIPPTEKKASNIEFVSRTIERESTALEDANTVFVIGYSQPATDADQRKLIRTAVAKRTKPIDRLIVVNRGESVEYFDRIACYFRFPKAKMEIYNSGFSEFVEEFDG